VRCVYSRPGASPRADYVLYNLGQAQAGAPAVSSAVGSTLGIYITTYMSRSHPVGKKRKKREASESARFGFVLLWPFSANQMAAFDQVLWVSKCLSFLARKCRSVLSFPRKCCSVLPFWSGNAVQYPPKKTSGETPFSARFSAPKFRSVPRFRQGMLSSALKYFKYFAYAGDSSQGTRPIFLLKRVDSPGRAWLSRYSARLRIPPLMPRGWSPNYFPPPPPPRAPARPRALLVSPRLAAVCLFALAFASLPVPLAPRPPPRARHSTSVRLPRPRASSGLG
jgi:hypothetical protein